MYNRLTKSTISFELTKRVNTDNTPYYAILYLMEDNNKILVENPTKGTCHQIQASEINKYVRLSKVKTNWFKNIDGSYVRIIDSLIEHILPITHEVELVNLNFLYKLSSKRELRRIRQVSEKNFKLVKISDSSIASNDRSYALKIEVFLPMWPMWIKVQKDLNAPDEKFSLRTVYMKHKDQFYRFPYGNVSGSDSVCTGAANNGYFETARQVWINWFTTQFNRDYTLNLKGNKFRFKLNTGRNSSREFVIEPTFNLDEIALKIYSKCYQNLNLLDTFYYLSNIEEFDNVEMDKFFIKLPQNPWEPKKN